MVCIAAIAAERGHAQSSRTTWTDYGGSPDNARYFTLDQINKKTLDQLSVAWTYPTADTISYIFNPRRRRQRHLRAGEKQFAGRARCHDRPRNLDSRGSVRHRAARHQLLGEQGPLRSAAALSDEQLSAGDRRAHRQVDSDVRQRRRGQPARRARTGSRDDREDAVVEPRKGVRESHHSRVGGRRELHGPSRRFASVRCGDRRARLAVPHHPAPGRVRLRNVASGRVEVHRRRQHVG